MFVKAPDVTYFWRRKAPFERLKRGLPREVWGACFPRKLLKKNTQKRCFQRFWKPSISFPGKAGVHSRSLKKVKFLIKMGRNGSGGGWRQQNF